MPQHRLVSTKIHSFKITLAGYLPDRSVRVSFWGWIWVIWSGFSFSATSFLRLVTGLFSSMVMRPRGFSTLALGHFLFSRDSRSSQRADLDSPTARKFCGRIYSNVILTTDLTNFISIVSLAQVCLKTLTRSQDVFNLNVFTNWYLFASLLICNFHVGDACAGTSGTVL